MSEGRTVRTWEYKAARYFSFLPWKGVRFVDDGEGAAAG
jgi:hypothetical protein